MKKIGQALLAALLVSALLLQGTGAAAWDAERGRDGLGNFAKVNSYQSGNFADVEGQTWYFDGVKTVYELGLMKGSSAERFNVWGNMTVAEAIAIAARVHSIYTTGGEQFVQGSPWYQVYYDYAVEQKVIETSVGWNRILSLPVTRSQFVKILSAALPDREYAPLNTVADDAIPDLLSGSFGGNEVYRFYRAGITTGNNKYGTFTPGAYISRAAAAAIVARMVSPDLRQKVSLTSPTGSITEFLGKKATEVLAVYGNAKYSEGYEDGPYFAFPQFQSYRFTTLDRDGWELDLGGKITAVGAAVTGQSVTGGMKIGMSEAEAERAFGKNLTFYTLDGAYSWEEYGGQYGWDAPFDAYVNFGSWELWLSKEYPVDEIVSAKAVLK